MKIESIRTTPLLAPLSRALTNASGVIEKVPLVLIDVATSEGVTGRAYVLVYFPQLLKAINETVLGLGEMVKGMALAPRDINAEMHRRVRLLGAKNLTGMALAGIDMAVWDAFARARKLPLAEALGGTRRPMPTYNSLGLYTANTVLQVCEETLERGFAGMKIKTGFPTFAEDLAAVRAAKKRLGNHTALMIDFNQSLTRAEALARCRGLDDEGVLWFEEPVAADDHEGCAQIAAQVKTPIMIGENFQGPRDMANALRAKAADYVMPDAQQIQGVSGWLEAAALANEAGIEMSSHLFVEASAHLLCVTPTAHWLEYMDWTSLILREPYRIEKGMVCAPDRPGLGLDWDEDKVKRYRLG
jgi:mandelate racemase